MLREHFDNATCGSLSECSLISTYGMWERGDKSNQNIVELTSSSVGMAKAALMAMKGINLFGARGGPASVIHVLPDETVKCSAVLESMLPRESNSKETDASILTIIGYPGFAVRKKELVEKTLETLIEKLRGKFPKVAAGRCPFMWAQALFIITNLLNEGLLVPAELDPLNRKSDYRVTDPCLAMSTLQYALSYLANS